MKICGINSYQAIYNNNNKVNKQPAFKGVYVVKGDWEDVEKISKKIIFEKQELKGVTDRSGFPLTSIYSDFQLDTRFLIATNEHTQNVRDFLALYAPILKGRFFLLGVQGADTPRSQQKVLKRLIEINNENKEEYLKAEKVYEKDNGISLGEILMELDKEAEDTQDFLYLLCLFDYHFL